MNALAPWEIAVDGSNHEVRLLSANAFPAQAASITVLLDGQTLDPASRFTDGGFVWQPTMIGNHTLMVALPVETDPKTWAAWVYLDQVRQAENRTATSVASTPATPVRTAERVQPAQSVNAQENFGRREAAASRSVRPVDSTLASAADPFPAGFRIRFLARIIDGAFAYFIGVGLLLVGGMVAGGLTAVTGSGIFAIIFFLLYLVAIGGYWVYHWSTSGQTPGMLALGLRVVRVDGAPLSLKTGLIRAAACILSWLPFGLGFLWIIWSPSKRAWHDNIAGTTVVSEREVPLLLKRWLLAIIVVPPISFVIYFILALVIGFSSAFGGGFSKGLTDAANKQQNEIPVASASTSSASAVKSVALGDLKMNIPTHWSVNKATPDSIVLVDPEVVNMRVSTIPSFAGMTITTRAAAAVKDVTSLLEPVDKVTTTDVRVGGLPAKLVQTHVTGSKGGVVSFQSYEVAHNDSFYRIELVLDERDVGAVAAVKKAIASVAFK